MALYSENRARINAVASLCSDEIEGPFLMSPGQEYWEAPRRLLCVGQETNGWTCHSETDQQMRVYQEFGLGKAYYSSPFWNVIRKLERTVIGTDYCCAWANLNRFDGGGKPPSAEDSFKLAELDFLLEREIEILQPSVIVFFTCWRNDHRVLPLLDPVEVQESALGSRMLVRVISSRSDALMFRTYHPNYLRKSRTELAVLGAISDWVRRCS